MSIKSYGRNILYKLDNLKRKGHSVYYGKHVKKMVEQYGLREEDKKFNTHMTHRWSNGWTRASRQMDHMIEQLLDREIYTEKNMLVLQDPYNQAPLTAMVIFNTKEPCVVKIHVGEDEIFDHTTKAQTRHRVPVLGLKPNCKNTIVVEVYRENELLIRRKIDLMTEKAPSILESPVHIREKKEKSRFPLIFVYGGDSFHPYAFDEQAQVRYYLTQRPKSYGIFPISGGHFMFFSPIISEPSFASPHSVMAYEMDFLGRCYREYLVMDGIHHDGCEKEPGGNILTISSSMEQYVEDSVIEIDRKTGKVVKKLCLEQVLSEHPYFDYFDWAHINTVSYQKEENTVLLCMRNLHSIMKMDWDTHEIHWILCDTSFWKGTVYEEKVLTPEDNMPFSYQAHAAYFLPERDEKGRRRLIVYDNHVAARRKIDTFDKDKKSYTKIYVIDEENHTVALESAYATPKSKIRSNALIDGDRVFSMSGYLLKTAKDGSNSLVTEFDRETGEKRNEYGLKKTYYRAYPFNWDYDQLSQPMEEGPSQIYGDLPKGKLVLPDVVSGAIKKKYRPLERARMDLTIEEKIEEIKVTFYENLILLHGRDHLIEKAYIAGNNHAYEFDYSATEQKLPHIFGEFYYAIVATYEDFEPDSYQVYVQVEGKIYNCGESFEISSKENE